MNKKYNILTNIASYKSLSQHENNKNFSKLTKTENDYEIEQLSNKHFNSFTLNTSKNNHRTS